MNVPSHSRDETAAVRRFADAYAADQTDAAQLVERDVIGANVGANGYTTLAQADLLADRLHLRPGMRLLGIGSGRGWPGLCIAKRSKCEVVLSDLTPSALREAARRARLERLQRHTVCIVASANALPFKPGAFDAAVHADVLC